jgi:hypothetical protein
LDLADAKREHLTAGRAEKPSSGDQNFTVWGHDETRIDELTFDRYHLFQCDMRMIPAFNQAPDPELRRPIF